MVKAIVLAAGAGTRLRPLTYETPKPMVPVVNRPVIHHVLDNLLRHGIKEVAVNLFAHADQVRGYCGDGSRWSLKIRYSPEPKLMGTAGAVKKVEGFLKDGPFFVMSGDGLSDIDLTAMLAFHRKRRSLATMAVKAVDSRFDYGVTLLGASGRIRGFKEKPSWSDVFSNMVNTGIYLFEPEVLRHIPRNKVYDFGHELWPKLLKLRKPIYAYECKGYWTDVGNLSEYRRCQIDALDRNIRINIPGTEAAQRRLGRRRQRHRPQGGPARPLPHRQGLPHRGRRPDRALHRGGRPGRDLRPGQARPLHPLRQRDRGQGRAPVQLHPGRQRPRPGEHHGLRGRGPQHPRIADHESCDRDQRPFWEVLPPASWPSISSWSSAGRARTGSLPPGTRPSTSARPRTTGKPGKKAVGSTSC